MIKKPFVISLVIAAFVLGFHQGNDPRTLHFKSIVVDTHNDVVQRMLAGEDISFRTSHGHSDLPRFIEGGLDVEMFSIWVPPERKHQSYFEQANEQIDSIESFARRNPGKVGLARSTKEIERLLTDGKFCAMLGLEGGHHIESDVKKLEHFYRRGVRYMTLTWNNSTDWATSAKDETDTQKELPRKGLNDHGKSLVRRMNELGMLVDVSHVGEKTFWDVMEITTKPVIASHSSAWSLCRHRRNLKDDQLKAVAKNGGVVCINFAPWFVDSTFGAKEDSMLKANKARVDSFTAANELSGDFVSDQYVGEFLMDRYNPIRPTLDQLINHFDYVARLVGVDYVGIGSDFDGITVPPAGMDDVTFLPNITRELLRRGYSESDVRKILGENVLRVLKANETN